MTTSEYFRKARITSGKTQRQVADHLGFANPQFISNVERGLASPSLSSVRKWCKFIKADRAEVIKLMMSEYEEKIRRVIK